MILFCVLRLSLQRLNPSLTLSRSARKQVDLVPGSRVNTPLTVTRKMREKMGTLGANITFWIAMM